MVKRVRVNQRAFEVLTRFEFSHARLGAIPIELKHFGVIYPREQDDLLNVNIENVFYLVVSKFFPQHFAIDVRSTRTRILSHWKRAPKIKLNATLLQKKKKNHQNRFFAKKLFFFVNKNRKFSVQTFFFSYVKMSPNRTHKTTLQKKTVVVTNNVQKK